MKSFGESKSAVDIVLNIFLLQKYTFQSGQTKFVLDYLSKQNQKMIFLYFSGIVIKNHEGFHEPLTMNNEQRERKPKRKLSILNLIKTANQH